MKLLVRIVLVLVLLLILVVALLPSMVSTGGVRTRVVEQANRAMMGSLAIDEWSLGWLSGITLKGIRYRDPAGLEVLEVQALRIERGLLGLASNYQRIGRVSVTNPTVRVPLPAGPRTTSGRSPPDQPAPASAPTPADTPREGREPPVSIPNLHVELAVEGGRVALVRSDGESAPVVDELQVDLQMNGVAEPIRLSAGFRMGGGSVAVDGSADLQGRTDLDPNVVNLATTLRLDAVRLDEISELVAAFAEAPTATGNVNGRVDLAGSLDGGISVKGGVQATALRLRGEALKGDVPALGDAEITLDARLAEDTLTLSELALRSDLAQVSAQGTIGASTAGELRAEADVDVAAVLQQFPRTIGLREGLTLSSGRLRATADLRRRGDLNELEASVVLSPVRGVKDGAELVWEHPTTMGLRGAVGPELVRIDRFELQSPFLTGQGSGDLDKMELTVRAQVGRGVEEMRKWVDLGAWDAAGDLRILAKMEAVDHGDRNVSVQLLGTDISVRSGDQSLLSSVPLTFRGDAVVRGLGGGAPPSVQDLQAGWNLWLSKGQLKVAEVAPPAPATPASGPLPRVVDAVLEEEGDLARLTAFLQGLGVLAPDQAMAGQAVLTAQASLRNQMVYLDQLEATVADFQYRQSAQSIHEPKATLTARGTASPSDQRIRVESAVLAFSGGRFQVAEATAAAGGAGVEPTLRGRMTGAVDLARVAAQLKDFVSLPEGVSLDGQSRIDLTFEPLDGGRQSANLEARAEGVTLRNREGPVVNDEQAVLHATFVRDGASGQVELDPLNLQSSPASLSAMARFVPSGRGGELDVRGDLALDLESIEGYVNALAGTSLTLRGKHPEPFFLQSRWTGEPGENMLANTTFSAGLTADRMEGFGLSIEQLKIPMSLSDGVAQARIEAGVNQGRLAAYPVIDFNASSPRLVLNQPTNLLTNVRITPEVAEELLSLVHPLFVGVTAVEGAMDLAMSHFAWPLDPAQQNQARFGGVMDFADLRVTSSGLWFQILEAAKIKEREMSIGDREVEFLCENGRIRTSPITIEVQDTDLVIAGSMGLDQTLDYVAQIPVTEELVGKEAFSILEGTSIRLPITGSARSPNLGLNVFEQALTDLAGQAIRTQLEKQAGKLIESLFK